MHLTHPRIAPVEDHELSLIQQEALKPVRQGTLGVLNIFRTFVRAPEAFKAFMPWGTYILRDNALSPRQREIVVLRIGFLCRSGYEWTQHVGIGKRAGLKDAEIDAIKAGAKASNWSAADAALIAMCDELHARQFVSDATWAALKVNFSERQCMDAVLTAAQYTQVSMLLNTFGVQLDEGQTLDPDLDAR